MSEILTIVPTSHEDIPIEFTKQTLRFAVDELGIFAQRLQEKGMDLKIVSDTFIEVSGTMR